MNKKPFLENFGLGFYEQKTAQFKKEIKKWDKKIKNQKGGFPEIERQKIKLILGIR